MPDESCRTCGGELTRCTVCAECRKPVSMICTQCGTRTNEQVHALCFSFGPGQANPSLAVGNGIFLKPALAA